MKEEIFLDIIRRTLPESACYIGDDTAFIPEKDLILTQDTLVEDIHFRLSSITPFYLGRKAIAVNLSDIAASGGVPRYITISLSMPKNTQERFIEDFYSGVRSICKEYDVLVVGGDLTASEKITVSVCVVASGKGLTPAGRKNAKPGDVVTVTGNFGSSRAGLNILEEQPEIRANLRAKFTEAHINPVPRLGQGRRILQAAQAPAMMDASDGLADALYKISQASGVSMEIDFGQIPYDRDILEFADFKTLRDWVFFGGEDYELVATMPEQVYEQLREEFFIRKIGLVREGCGLLVDSKVFRPEGMFRHFE